MRRLASLLLLIISICLFAACRHAGQEEILQLAPAATPQAEEAAPSPSPNPIPTLLKQAEDSISRGEYKGAEAFYQQAIAWDSEAVDAYLAYAACRLLQDDPLSALSILEDGVLALGGSGISASLPLREQWWRTLVGMRQEGGARIDRQQAAQLAELAYISARRCVASTQEYTKAELLLAPYMYLNISSHYTHHAEADTAEKAYVYRSGLLYPPHAVVEFEGSACTAYTPEQAIAFMEGVYGASLPDPHAEYMRGPNAASQQGVSSQFFCDGSLYYFPLSGYTNTAYFAEEAAYLGHDLYYVTFGQDWMSTPSSLDLPGMVPGALHLLLQRTDGGWGFFVRAVIRHGEGTLLEEGWPEMPLDTAIENAASSYPSLRTPAEREADLPAYEAQKQDGEDAAEEGAAE